MTEKIKWNDDVIIKQLISYAVGVWMGRYRLDRKGLYIAHPNPSDEELSPYIYNGETVEIDDGIFPLMATDCGFSDNAVTRMAEFVRIVFGKEQLNANLNYMEQCLGKSLEQYFIKDFWNDHKKMYQNRPIYWLFASKKGAFQVLVYMHRMNEFTASRIRNNYLLPYIQRLQQTVTTMEQKSAYLNRTETKILDTAKKALAECNEYDIRLNDIAHQQIKLDLDDGVEVNYAKFGDVVKKRK